MERIRTFLLLGFCSFQFTAKAQPTSDPKDADRAMQRCAANLHEALAPIAGSEWRSLVLAVVEVKHLKGGHPSLVEYVELELNKNLASSSAANGYKVFKLVEQTMTDVVLEQQRLNGACRGLITAACIIELGENLAADRLITVEITDDPAGGKHWWRLYLTVHNARDGHIQYSTHEKLYFKERDEEVRPPRKERPRSGGSGMWNDGFACALHGSYENYFDTWRPSGAIDIGTNAGEAFLGLRLGFMPDIIRQSALPFDIGYLAQLQPSEDLPANQQGILAGNNAMALNEMALITTGTILLQWDHVESAADDGIEQFTFDRIRMSDVRAYRYSIHPFLRYYMGDRVDERSRAKIFIDFGVGWDWIRAEAKYSVTRSVVRRNPDYTYSTSQLETTPESYDYAGFRSGLKLGTLLFGAGFEVSRFMISASWRTVFGLSFAEPDQDYRRIKGDIMLLPLLNSEVAGINSVKTGLQTDGSLVYGRTDIQRTTESGIAGNGVKRFLDRSNVVVSFGIRLF